jgi:uncharacterized protein (TIGR02271 family)
MSAAIVLVTDRDGVRGFIDASEGGWTPTAGHSIIQLSDGGRVRVANEVLVELEDGHYLLPGSLGDLLRDGEAQVEPDVIRVPVVAEQLHVETQVRETGTVRLDKRVHTRSEHVEVPLVHEEVETVRVPIGRVVDGPIPVRQEGDTTIFSLLEEVLVIEKRWVLREEVHLRVRRTEHLETQTVELRSEEVTVQRTDPTIEAERARPTRAPAPPRVAPPPPPPPKKGETP